MFGSLGASAFLLISGRRPAAAALAGIGLAALASEYPDEVEQLWERAPEYVAKGTQVMNMISAFVERVAEHRALHEGRQSSYVV